LLHPVVVQTSNTSVAAAADDDDNDDDTNQTGVVAAHTEHLPLISMGFCSTTKLVFQ